MAGKCRKRGVGADLTRLDAETQRLLVQQMEFLARQAEMIRQEERALQAE